MGLCMLPHELLPPSVHVHGSVLLGQLPRMHRLREGHTGLHLLHHTLGASRLSLMGGADARGVLQEGRRVRQLYGTVRCPSLRKAHSTEAVCIDGEQSGSGRHLEDGEVCDEVLLTALHEHSDHNLPQHCC